MGIKMAKMGNETKKGKNHFISFSVHWAPLGWSKRKKRKAFFISIFFFRMSLAVTLFVLQKKEGQSRENEEQSQEGKRKKQGGEKNSVSRWWWQKHVQLLLLKQKLFIRIFCLQNISPKEERKKAFSFLSFFLSYSIRAPSSSRCRWRRCRRRCFSTKRSFLPFSFPSYSIPFLSLRQSKRKKPFFKGWGNGVKKKEGKRETAKAVKGYFHLLAYRFFSFSFMFFSPYFLRKRGGGCTSLISPFFYYC